MHLSLSSVLEQGFPLARKEVCVFHPHVFIFPRAYKLQDLEQIVTAIDEPPLLRSAKPYCGRHI